MGGRLRDEEDAGCEQDTAKSQSRKPLRSKPMLLLAIACAILVSYASDLFAGMEGLADFQEQESSLRRMLSDEEDDVGGDGPTFVFIAGIEGTGHHFIESLLKESPNMMRMEELGLCSSGGRRTGELLQLSKQFFDSRRTSSALFNPTESAKKNIDAETRYKTVVALLSSIRHKFNKQQVWEGKNTDGPFHVAINANACNAVSMFSFPNYEGPDRALQNFNLDLFYNACADAKVQCKHAYIYRDPYDVIKSTGKNRGFNTISYDSIRLYTSVLQQVHSQLVSFPERNLGCFGFLDAKGYHLQQDWERFGRLWGWESTKSFLATAKKINTKNGPIPMSEDMKAKLVPARLLVMMRAFEDIHNRVNDFCYSSLSSMEDQVVPGEVPPNAGSPKEEKRL